ncbi:MAG: carbohydrate binding domain-containing protein [Desulfobacterales bacterium]
MKKPITLLLFALSFILCAYTNALCQTENLVLNPGFEQRGDDTLAAGWQTKVYRGTNVEFTLDEKTRHSGDLAFKTQFIGKGGSVMLFPKDKIDRVTPGQTYKISLWVKARNLGYSPNFIAPAVRFNFRPTRIRPVPTIDLMAEMKGATEWQELSLTSKAPADAEEIVMQILLTKGTIWIDDVAITAVAGE